MSQETRSSLRIDAVASAAALGAAALARKPLQKPASVAALVRFGLHLIRPKDPASPDTARPARRLPGGYPEVERGKDGPGGPPAPATRRNGGLHHG